MKLLAFACPFPRYGTLEFFPVSEAARAMGEHSNLAFRRVAVAIAKRFTNEAICDDDTRPGLRGHGNGITDIRREFVRLMSLEMPGWTVICEKPVEFAESCSRCGHREIR